MNILIMDAQGGGVGRMLIEGLKNARPGLQLTAVGTNALATSAMLRAGADQGATGENAVRVCTADADLILGPIGIVLCDAMLGEVTAEMACAVGRSKAKKILVPMNRCQVTVAGTSPVTMAEAAADAVRKAIAYIDSKTASAEA